MPARNASADGSKNRDRFSPNRDTCLRKGRVQKQVRRAGGVSPLILHPGENQGANAPRSPWKLFLDAPKEALTGDRGSRMVERREHRFCLVPVTFLFPCPAVVDNSCSPRFPAAGDR